MTRTDEAHEQICVVGGAGHVGLPLGISLAGEGLPVLLYDANASALERIAAGQMPFEDAGAEPVLMAALDKGLLRVTSDSADVEGATTFVITIGTPVDEFMNPVQKVIRTCAEDLMPHVSDDTLVVLRSTVYPGTTDWLDQYFRSNGLHPKTAYCPERVVQGHAFEEIRRIPQIVSGTTRAAEEAAAALFARLAPSLVRLSPMEAEFAKLFGNAYRYIKFAAANQFYTIANAAGVDYNRVLAGMKQDYDRARDIPSAGLTAGPCLFKDTMQLAAFANNQFTLGHTAMVVNEGLVLYLAEDIARRFGDLSEKSIGLLGMAFKANSGDTRASLSYKLKKVLQFRAERVLTTDPHVVGDPDLLPLTDVVARSDVLVLCAPHDVYRGLDTGGKPIVDIWGMVEG